MRRKDREITDLEEIKSIFEEAQICHLGFNDKGKVYIVPVNYGYEENNGSFCLYFHSATEGRKIDCINKTHTASFEIDCGYELKTDVTACGHGAYYKCIMGEGNIDFITEAEEKKYALNKLMLHATGKGNWTFPTIMLNRVKVIKLEVKTLTAKARKK